MQDYIVSEHDNEGMKYYLKYWLAKLQANASKSFKDRKLIFIEALRYIPSSYKLWKMMFDQAFIYLNDRCILYSGFSELNDDFEASLFYMSKMPRIWIYYAKFLYKQGLYVKLVELLDRALKSLSVTQHDKIWAVHQDMLGSIKTVEIGKMMFTRYLKYDPTVIEDYIDYLLERNQFTDAVENMLSLLRNPNFYSKKNISKYEYSMKLSKIMAEKSKYIEGINCKDVFVYFLNKYTDEIGTLWIFFADYYIQLGLFENARAIFDQALDSVKTLRDFSVVYNAYLRFEEELLNMYMQEDEQELDQKEIELEQSIDMIFGYKNQKKSDGLSNEDFQLKRLENLLEKQPFLLNATKLRQNPNSVKDWSERADLHSYNPAIYLNVFREAFKQINSAKAEGELSSLWIKLANFYKDRGQTKDMNIVFEQSLKVNYRRAEEYTKIVRVWVEYLLSHNYIDDCIAILSSLLLDSSSATTSLSFHVKNVIRKSNSLWSLLADIHYNYSDFSQLEKVYQKMLETQIASPLNLLNYIKILLSLHKYEAAFGVCETSIKSFAWPAAYHFWLVYLDSFEQHMLGEHNVERLRDLYLRVLQEAPVTKSKLKRLDLLFDVWEIRRKIRAAESLHRGV